MMASRRFVTSLAPALVLLAAVSACATSKPPGSGPGEEAAVEQGNNDPFESVNRKIFVFNMTLDRYFFKPVAETYRDYTPQFVQTGLTNLLTNLKSPAILLNDALQGNGERAGQTFARLWLNTILGLGGLIDVGTSVQIPFHDADFGQTMGAWGVPPGPFLMLPLLGPSDPRDAVGFGVDSIADPFGIKMHAAGLDDANYARTGSDLINERAQNIDTLDELQRSSLDFYAALRSLYQQKRAADVEAAKTGGAAGQPSPGPSYEVEPSTPAPSDSPAPSSGPGS